MVGTASEQIVFFDKSVDETLAPYLDLREKYREVTEILKKLDPTLRPIFEGNVFSEITAARAAFKNAQDDWAAVSIYSPEDLLKETFFNKLTEARNSLIEATDKLKSYGFPLQPIVNDREFAHLIKIHEFLDQAFPQGVALEKSLGELFNLHKKNQVDIIGKQNLPLAQKGREVEDALSHEQITGATRTRIFEILSNVISDLKANSQSETPIEQEKQTPEQQLKEALQMISQENPPVSLMDAARDRLVSEQKVVLLEDMRVAETQISTLQTEVKAKMLAIVQLTNQVQALTSTSGNQAKKIESLNTTLAQERIALADAQGNLTLEQQHRAELQVEIARMKQDPVRHPNGTETTVGEPVEQAVDRNPTTTTDNMANISEVNGDSDQSNQPEQNLKKTEKNNQQPFINYADRVFNQSRHEFIRLQDVNNSRPETLRPDSRSHTLSQYSTERENSPTSRFGLFSMIDAFGGKALEQFADGEQEAEAYLCSLNTPDVHAFGIAVETLASQPGSLKEIYDTLMQCISHVKARDEYYQLSTQRLNFLDVPLVCASKSKLEVLNWNTTAITELLSTIIGKLQEVNDSSKNKPKWLNDLILELKQHEAGQAWVDLQLFFSKQSESDVDWKTYNWADQKNSPTSITDDIVAIAQKHAFAFTALRSTLIKVAMFTSFSVVSSEMQRLIPNSTQAWDSPSDEIKLTNARNPYSVLMSAKFGGTALTELTHYQLNKDGLSRRSTEWPPVLHYPDSVRGTLAKSIGHEIPISLHLKSPITLFTGNNGAGKTHAIETLIQHLGKTQTIGITATAEQVRTPKIFDLRSLIGASKHDQSLSSFQRDASYLANALKSFEEMENGDIAMLVVDEVGKGTDSRDAIALMIAVSEFCRRKNIFLVMATHHGKEMVKIAREIGLDDSISIFAPNFDDHQLIEYPEVVDSHGIEVMQRRAQAAGLPNEVTQVLVDNAIKLRRAHNNDDVVRLNTAELSIYSNSARPLEFIDTQSLTDMGLKTKESSWGADTDYNLKPYHRLIWDSRSGHASIQRDTKQLWNQQFTKEFAEFSAGGEKQRIVDTFVDLMKNPEKRSQILELTTKAYLIATFFSQKESSGEIDLQYALNRIIKDDDPLTAWIDDRYVNQHQDFVEFFVDSNQRAKLFYTLRQLSAMLNETQIPRLQMIAASFDRLASLESKIADVISSADETKTAEIASALQKNLASALKRNMYSLKPEQVAQLKQDCELGDVTDSIAINQIASKLNTGDDELFKRVKHWIVNCYPENTDGKLEKKSWSTGTNILFAAKIDILNIEKIYVHLKKNDKTALLQKISAAFPNTTSLDDLKEQTIEACNNGDFTLLWKLMDFADSQGYRDSYGPAELSKFNRRLNYRRLWRWQEAAKELFSREQVDRYLDAYNLLELEPGADAVALKKQYRALARQHHPDTLSSQAITDEQRDFHTEKFGAIDGAYKLLDSRIKENPESLTRTLDVLMLRNLAYPITVANAVHELEMTRATSSQDGSLDIQGAIPVGLLNKFQLDQVVRQETFTWTSEKMPLSLVVQMETVKPGRYLQLAPC
ncbi:DnaJ domain-containing protein [Candidatus Woesebacteria bacterium]|nr:DnaJ domain-containing protein [Candidatus Woesebacteria bacterium]